MKYTLIIVLTFVCCEIISSQPDFYEWNEPTASQVLHAHGNQMPFPEAKIAEDFGPRQLK